jgi:hypothetical protein
MAGPCRVGDVLGLAEGDIVDIGSDVDAVASAVAERLLGGGGELLTLVCGSDLGTAESEALAETLQRRHPGVDVVTIDGGQPLWPVIVGVE